MPIHVEDWYGVPAVKEVKEDELESYYTSEYAEYLRIYQLIHSNNIVFNKSLNTSASKAHF